MDIETSGLNVKEHKIIEISAIELVNKKITGNAFHAFMKPGECVDPQSMKINGLETDFFEKNCADYYSEEKTILDKFSEFIGGSIIISHYAGFEFKFLQKAMMSVGLMPFAWERFLCTIDVFNELNAMRILRKKAKKRGLIKLCSYFDIPYNNKRLHTAMADSLLASKLIIKFWNIADSSLKEKEENKNKAIEEMLANENSNNEIRTRTRNKKNSNSNILKIRKNIFIIEKLFKKKDNLLNKTNEEEANNDNKIQLKPKGIKNAKTYLLLFKKGENFNNKDFINIKKIIQRIFKGATISFFYKRKFLFSYIKNQKKKLLNSNFNIIGQNYSLIDAITKMPKKNLQTNT